MPDGAASRLKASLLVATLALTALLGTAPPPTADLLLRHGTIYTGDAAPFIGDVALRGDRIVAVAPSLRTQARRTIDATGLIVAPGFIDAHTHVDEDLLAPDAQRRLVLSALMQGVTTVIIGNDGFGSYAVGERLASAAARPVGPNYATYVGFGPIRQAVIGEGARPPTADELQRMRALVAQGMCEGAIGFSTGLFYAPQSFARTDEVIDLAREAAKRGGLYDSHIRDESNYSIGLEGAVKEAIEIGAKAGMPVHIAHIKALGVDVQGQAPRIIADVEAARATGQEVTADQYPWPASGTSLVDALVPSWAQDGGRGAMLKRFDDPTLRDRLAGDMRENLRRRGGAASLLIIVSERQPALLGKRLSEIAAARHVDPVQAVIDVIRVENSAIASFNQSERDIEAFMPRPWVMTSSDGLTGHPRLYASFARKYAEYAVARRVISVRQFVEQSSRLTADTLHLTDRGRIRPHAFADLVVFDPNRYQPRATYEDPARTAAGVLMVIVNGRIEVQNGTPTGVAAGRALSHRAPAGTCPARRA